MRKIIIFTVLLGMIAGASVFAAGGQEDESGYGRRPKGEQDYGPEYGPGAGRRNGPGYGPRYEERWEGFDGEVLTLTGTVNLEGEWRPELETDDRTYELMYPPFLDDDLDVEDGEEITVEGYLVPGPRWEDAEEESDELHLHVTKAVIDGTEYVIAHPGPRHGGPRGGMAYGGPGSRRGGRGPGYYGGPGCWRDGGRSWDDGRGDARGYGRR